MWLKSHPLANRANYCAENLGQLSDTTFSGMPCRAKMDFTILITAELVVVGMLSNSKLIFTVVVSYNQIMFIFKFKQISSDN